MNHVVPLAEVVMLESSPVLFTEMGTLVLMGVERAPGMMVKRTVKRYFVRAMMLGSFCE